MRVHCGTLEEFLANISAVLLDGSILFQDTIYVSRVREGHIEGPNQRPVVFNVYFRASTLVVVEEQHQYMVETSIECGLDHEDAEPSREGSAKAKELMTKLEEFVNEAGKLRLLPGVVSE